MKVVNVRGAIDADADAAVVLEEKIAPFVVDQRAVGLEIVGDFVRRKAPFGDLAKRLFVVGDGNGQGLAGVPDDAQTVAHHAAFEDPIERIMEGFEGHFLGTGAVGEVAIVAIDVAERGGLQDQQSDVLHVGSQIFHVVLIYKRAGWCGRN